MEAVYSVEDENRVFKIWQDELADDPRNWDNLGKMLCWHRHHELGDKHSHRSPDDFFRAMAEELTGNPDRVARWDDDKVREYVLTSPKLVILPLYLLDHSGLSMRTYSFADVDPGEWDSGQVGLIYCTKEKLLKETGYNRKELFSKDFHRKPKAKDHVKLRNDDRDWGKVIKVRAGKVTVDFDYCKVEGFKKPENVVTVLLSEVRKVMANRAVEMLRGEVETYDQYLRGEVYGFSCIKKVKCETCGHVAREVVNSCGGFYGDGGLAQIREYLTEDWYDLYEEAVPGWVKKLAKAS